MPAELNSNQILGLMEEALKTLAATFRSRADKAEAAIESAQVATREAKIESIERAEQMADRVTRELVDPLVQGPLADARTDAIALMDEARSKADSYVDDCMRALDDFERSWIAVHRCYAVLTTKKYKVEQLVREILPVEMGTPREVCCEAMSVELLISLQPVQHLTADAYVALQDLDGLALSHCRPPPPDARVGDTAQTAVRDMRLATDRLSRMETDAAERIALEQAFRELVERIHEYARGCNLARSHGVGAVELLRTKAWLPISHEKSEMSAETFDDIKDETKVNMAALKTVLRRYARRLEGWS